MKRSHLVLLAAVLASLLLASGVGLAADRLVQPQAAALKTVSPQTLEQLGLSLTAAGAPPYCPILERLPAAPSRQGSAACPLSAQQAVERLQEVFHPQTVVETALARWSWLRNPSLGQGQLVWAVVLGVQLIKPVDCPVPAPGTNLPPCPAPITTSREELLVLLDAYDGRIVFKAVLPSSPAPVPITVPAAGAAEARRG